MADLTEDAMAGRAIHLRAASGNNRRERGEVEQRNIEGSSQNCPCRDKSTHQGTTQINDLVAMVE